MRTRFPGWLVLVSGLVVALILTGCGSNQPPQLPVPLADIMPEDWVLLDASNDQPNPAGVNIDDDDEMEWMILFSYDNPSPDGGGPIGGVIYDSQQDTEPYDPSVVVPFPYQPTAFLVPYRLLPDWREGKGQGYLGDTTVSWEQVRTDAVEPKYNELIIRGKRSGVDTRLSIFLWQDVTNGYQVAHFEGSQIVRPEQDNNGQVRKVVTLERFNKRTNLCSQVDHTRQGDSLEFVASEPAVVFCLGPSENPTYPEAVVVTWLFEREDDLLYSGQPTVLEEDRPDRLAQVKSQVEAVIPQELTRIVSVGYEGTARTEGVGNSAQSTMKVVTTIETTPGMLETYRWTLIEVRPGTSQETSRWRIWAVEPDN